LRTWGTLREHDENTLRTRANGLVHKLWDYA
jgi:hypothetical protein